MSRKVFINLPVKDLKRSMDFFSKLGFAFNPQFTNDDAACMVISEGSSYGMLLTEPFFQTFTDKPISYAGKATEVLIAFEVDSREEVESMVEKAVKAGGTIYREPEDHGWMYGHSFADPDGHKWEVTFMDATAIPEDPAAAGSMN